MKSDLVEIPCEVVRSREYSVKPVTKAILAALDVLPSTQVQCEKGCYHSAEDYVSGMIARAIMQAVEEMGMVPGDAKKIGTKGARPCK